MTTQDKKSKNKHTNRIKIKKKSNLIQSAPKLKILNTLWQVKSMSSSSKTTIKVTLRRMIKLLRSTGMKQ